MATLVLVPLVLPAIWFSLDDRTPETRAQHDLPRLLYNLTLLNGLGFPDSLGWIPP